MLMLIFEGAILSNRFGKVRMHDSTKPPAHLSLTILVMNHTIAYGTVLWG